MGKEYFLDAIGKMKCLNLEIAAQQAIDQIRKIGAKIRLHTYSIYTDDVAYLDPSAVGPENPVRVDCMFATDGCGCFVKASLDINQKSVPVQINGVTYTVYPHTAEVVEVFGDNCLEKATTPDKKPRMTLEIIHSNRRVRANIFKRKNS